jgi:hypothetical protein
VKLTKSQLKQIIKEELKESLHPSDREIQQELYDVLVRNGLDQMMAEKLLSNVGMDTLKNLLRVFKAGEKDETY